MANWALVVGINTYKRLRSLRYADRDARLIRDYFENEAGFERVFYFADNSKQIEAPDGSLQETQPIYANLMSFLHDFFEYDEEKENPPLKAGDNLWFFFSGHGLRYLGEDYLVPSNGNPRLVRETNIALSYVTQRLRRSGADNVMLLLDACRNENELGSKGVGIEKQQGVITIASCSPQQESYEIEEIRQGSFTYALLEALRIQGEGNCATVERLYQHLRHRVAEINAHYQKPVQTPYAIVEPASKYHLILLPDYATLTDIATLKIDAFQAEAEEKWGLAKQLWVRVNVAARGSDLQAIQAFQRIERLRQQQEIETKPKVTEMQQARQQQKRKEEERRRQQERAEEEQRQRDETERLRQQQEAERLGRQQSTTITPLRPITRKQFLKWSGLGGAVLITAVVAREIFTDQSPLPITLETFDFEVKKVNAQGEVTEKQKSQAQFFKEDLGNGVNLDMVKIPGGKFWMGTKDEEIERLVKKFGWDGYRREKPRHEVTVKDFFIGKFQVTQAQWRAISSLPKVSHDLELEPSSFSGDDLPVENVSWNCAQEFCRRLSTWKGRTYRLPTEAEWEYACRAGTSTPFHFGETITYELANYDARESYASELIGEYQQKTVPVGSFSPNTFGLYDMHGNVYEWCEDNWHDNYRNAPDDGNAWLLGGTSNKQVLRGGSWEIPAGSCRSAYRYPSPRDNRRNFIGFRVACVAPKIA